MASGDDFSSFNQSRTIGRGRFRFASRNSKYVPQTVQCSIASKEKLAGSNSCLAAFGSNQNLFDPTKLMTMQDEARERRISSEIMKHRLYESVITSPRRRRMSMRMDSYGSLLSVDAGGGHAPWRMAQSMPVTPMMSPGESRMTTPSHSPTQSRRFIFGYYSKATSPSEDVNMITDQGGTAQASQGLAGVLKPALKKFGMRHKCTVEVYEPEGDGELGLGAPQGFR